MHVYYLEQKHKDVPAENGWLNATELLRLDGLRFQKRREDWRLGRWTAKRLVAAWLCRPDGEEEFRRIEIRPAESGAPEVLVDDELAPLTISLSHRSGVALCALAPHRTEFGCDLEQIEERDGTFLTDYFTAEERKLIGEAPRAERARIATLLWSAKESVLKAMRTGLRLDTRSVVVRPMIGTDTAIAWRPLRAYYDGRMFQGCWREEAGLVRTLAGMRGFEPAAPFS